MNWGIFIGMILPLILGGIALVVFAVKMRNV